MVVDPIPNPSTMKLHVLSDLHTEFADFDLPETGADVVILAGDVGVGSGGLEWLQKQRLDKPVIYVPGNHEFYGHDISLVERLRNNAPSNVHVLDNQSIVIEDVRFLGSILWTDFQLFGASGSPAASTRGSASPPESCLQNALYGSREAPRKVMLIGAAGDIHGAMDRLYDAPPS